MLDKLMHALLYFISGFMKVKIINNENGEPYLERYMISRKGKEVHFLHRFLDSDSDRGVHDHPWDYSRSFILAGGYNEERLVEENGVAKVILRDVRPFSINEIRGNDFHRVVLRNKKPAWTVFYHADRVKHWGFQEYKFKSLETREIDKIHYEDYNDKTNPNDRWEDKATRGFWSKRKPLSYSL